MPRAAKSVDCRQLPSSVDSSIFTLTVRSPSLEKQTMKRNKKKWSLTFCQELPSSTDSSLSPKQFGLPYWEKDLIKQQQTRCDHLHCTKRCHAIIGWFLYFHVSNFMSSMRKDLIKKHKQELITQMPPSVCCSLFSYKAFGALHWEKDFIKQEQTGSDHLHFPKSCHHRLIPLF